MRDISNSDNVIDSRDVIKRIEALENERDPLWDAFDSADSESKEAADAALKAFDDDDDLGGELTRLRALAEEGESLSDWAHGETLIRDSYFEDYARELADDIGAIKSDAGWPMNYIDWPRAADALKMDYTSLKYGDVTYWARS